MRLSRISLIAVALYCTGALPVHASVQADNYENLGHTYDRVLFDASTDLREVQVLSVDEMRSTEGAVNPFLVGAAGGAAINGVKYGLGLIGDKGRSFNKGDLAKTMAAGAGIGVLTGPAAGAAGGGLSVGANVWRFNGAAANFAVDQAMKPRGSNQNGGSPR